MLPTQSMSSVYGVPVALTPIKSADQTARQKQTIEPKAGSSGLKLDMAAPGLRESKLIMRNIATMAPEEPRHKALALAMNYLLKPVLRFAPYHQTLLNAVNPVFNRFCRILFRMSGNLSASTVMIDRPDGSQFWGEWVEPKSIETGKKPIVLWIPGGAHALGSPHTHRLITRPIAHLTNTKVFSIDYRKGPDYPYPAGLNDVKTAFQYLLKQGYCPEDIVLAGDSAGGHLVASFLLDPDTPAPKAAVLISPLGDLVRIPKQSDLMLPVQSLPKIATKYSGKNFHPADPRISPLNTSADSGHLKKLKNVPIYMDAGEKEALRDHAERFAHLFSKAGAPTCLTLWQGMFHAFSLFPTPSTQAARENIAGFIKDPHVYMRELRG